MEVKFDDILAEYDREIGALRGEIIRQRVALEAYEKALAELKENAD